MRIRESLHEDKEGEIIYILWKSDKSGATIASLGAKMKGRRREVLGRDLLLQ